MNKNTIIAIGAVVLVLLLGTGLYMRNNSEKIDKDNKTVEKFEAKEGTEKVEGSVVSEYEGSHKLSYSFDIPEDATTTLKNESGTILHVTNASGTLVAAFYFSYEGARGYSAHDYITNVTAKKVSTLTVTGETKIGNSMGAEAESNGTEWKVMPARDGEFLVVIEYPKSQKDAAQEIIDSFESN